MSPNLRFQCPACKSTLEAGVSHAGEKVRCLKCGQKLLVPIPPNANNKTVLAPMVETATLIVDAAPTPGAVVALSKPMPPPLPEVLPDGDPTGRAQLIGFALAALAALQARSRLQSILEWRRPLMANTLWPALLLFFLPWTNVSCNDQVFIRQSGFQSCYGGSTPTAAQLREMHGPQPNGPLAVAPSRPDSLPVSPLSWLFALALAAGIACGAGCFVCLLASFRNAAIGLEHSALLAGSACFVLLVAQMIFGFPIERYLQAQMPANATVAVAVQYSAWFWMTLLLTFLSVPLFLAEAGVTAAGLLRGRRASLISTAVALALAIGVASTGSGAKRESIASPLDLEQAYPRGFGGKKS